VPCDHTRSKEEAQPRDESSRIKATSPSDIWKSM